MPIPPYVRTLRERVGSMTLLLPSTAAVIRDEAGRVLLIRRGDGRGWSLPGGCMEPGERLVECLRREVWEETGLQVEPLRVPTRLFRTGASALLGPISRGER